MDAIINVQSEYHTVDGDIRYLIALISDTGMRLAEGAGLLKQDFVGFNTKHPYVSVVKPPWRKLKTASSECKYLWLEKPYGLLGAYWRPITLQTLPSQGTIGHQPKRLTLPVQL